MTEKIVIPSEHSESRDLRSSSHESTEIMAAAYSFAGAKIPPRGFVLVGMTAFPKI